SNALVYIGQNLRIPESAPRAKRAKTSARQPPTKTIAAKTTLRETNKTLPEAKPDSPPEVSSNYILTVTKTFVQNGISFGEILVQPEESLGLYSEWLEVPESFIYSTNGIPADAFIHAGRRLVVPFVAVSKKEFENRRKHFHKETEEEFFSSYKITGFKKYMVAAGDTLWQISRDKFDLPLWLLKRYNTDLSYEGLFSDQYLQIPIIEPL
ncbi:MAG: LysM peptidoglycan-binding domain-containing protein, partial [Desulfopila sp.]|nr:LysM peptidoglycan-binding domain-containing protein [Desulfopila sp.]